MEDSVIRFAFWSVAQAHLDAQRQIMPLLRKVLAVDKRRSPAHAIRRHRSDSQLSGSGSGIYGSMLLQTILDGLTTERNRPMQIAWIRFVVSVISEAPNDFQPLTFPIIDTMCELLRAVLAGTVQQVDDVCLELLSAIDIVSLRGLAGAVETTSKTPRTTSEPVGLFGYVTGVLNGDTGSNPVDSQAASVQSRSDALQCLAVVCRSMQTVCLGRRDRADDKLATAAFQVLRRHQQAEPRIVLEALIDAMVPEMLVDQAGRPRRSHGFR